MSGRGAWPSSGSGGTYDYKASTPGPYYYLGSGENARDANERAVRGAVKAYQRALNREMDSNLTVDGVLGPVTSGVIKDFQASLDDDVMYPVWGGIGPETSKALLSPALHTAFTNNPHHPRLTESVVCGIISHESGWDAGAVGYVDDDDLGLAQINGTAHPEYSDEDRLKPFVAFNFVMGYLSNSLNTLAGVLDDAILSYNLGIGGWSDTYHRLVGVKGWIADGRPNMWTPPGQSTPRDCRGYITTVKTACA